MMGLRLAAIDLEQRGAGDFFGSQQTGFPEAALIATQYPDIIELSKKAVAEILENDVLKNAPILQERYNRYIAGIHLE